jgi:hypothetical protein
MRSDFRTNGRFTSLAASAEKLLRQITDKPKYQIIHNIVVNWKNIIDERYWNYCVFEKITLDKSCESGTAYIISYNSSASFYLGSSGQYIVDKMNSVLGRKLIVKILVREIPMVVNSLTSGVRREKKVETRKTQGNGTHVNPLEGSLEELGECFKSGD